MDRLPPDILRSFATRLSWYDITNYTLACKKIRLAIWDHRGFWETVAYYNLTTRPERIPYKKLRYHFKYITSRGDSPKYMDRSFIAEYIGSFAYELKISMIHPLHIQAFTSHALANGHRYLLPEPINLSSNQLLYSAAEGGYIDLVHTALHQQVEGYPTFAERIIDAVYSAYKGRQRLGNKLEYDNIIDLLLCSPSLEANHKRKICEYALQHADLRIFRQLFPVVTRSFTKSANIEMYSMHEDSSDGLRILDIILEAYPDTLDVLLLINAEKPFYFTYLLKREEKFLGKITVKILLRITDINIINMLIKDGYLNEETIIAALWKHFHGKISDYISRFSSKIVMEYLLTLCSARSIRDLIQLVCILSYSKGTEGIELLTKYMTADDLAFAERVTKYSKQ